MNIFQDGRIDYNEFASMMTKGNANLGQKRLPNTFSISLRDGVQSC